MEVEAARLAVLSLVPKFPTGDTWAVFGDNKLRASCWNGGWGGAVRRGVTDAKVSDWGHPGRFW